MTPTLTPTDIPYLTHVWNVVTGCGDEQASPGCAHCYARAMTGRFADVWGYDWTPTFHEDRLEAPLHRRKRAVVGITFMGDLWHRAFTDEQRDAVFDVIGMTPHIVYVDLTKRSAERRRYMREMRVDDLGHEYPLPNLVTGSTICNQAEADRDIGYLLDTPSACRIVSVEPMLGPVDLDPTFPGSIHSGDYVAQLDWVILGGETGPGARPMQPQWALSVYRQCREAGVPFFFKQWGGKIDAGVKAGTTSMPDEWSRMMRTRELPEATP
jgi:protein gp37